MMKITLRYENGIFKSVTPVAGFTEGDEVEVNLPIQYTDAEVDEMLDKSRGAWADIDFDIEGFIQEAKEKSAQASAEKYK